VFEHCRQLSDVDLSFCTQLGDTDVLGVLPLTVRTLSLCGVQLTDADRLASVLKRLTGLRVVRLSGVPAVTDDSLEEVSSGFCGRPVGAASWWASTSINQSICQSINQS